MFFQCTLCLRCQDTCPAGIAMHDIFQAAGPTRATGPGPHAPCLGRAIRGGEASPGPFCRAIATAITRPGRAGPPGVGQRTRGRPAGVDRPDGDPGRLRPSGTAGLLLLSPLLASDPSGAAEAATGIFRRAGYTSEARVLTGTSLFRRFWGGDRDGLRAAVAAAEADLPAGVPRLFAEPELAIWWREAGPSPGSGAPVLDLADVAAREMAAASAPQGPFTVLPPPVPLDGAGWAAGTTFGGLWSPPAGGRCRTPGALSGAKAWPRGIPRRPASSAVPCWLPRPPAASPSWWCPRSGPASWLRGSGAPGGGPRLSLLPVFLERLAR